MLYISPPTLRPPLSVKRASSLESSDFRGVIKTTENQFRSKKLGSGSNYVGEGPCRDTPQEAYLDFIENEKTNRKNMKNPSGPGWRCVSCSKLYDVFKASAPFTQGLNELLTWQCPTCVSIEDANVLHDTVFDSSDSDSDSDSDSGEMRKNPAGDPKGYYKTPAKPKRSTPLTESDDDDDDEEIVVVNAASASSRFSSGSGSSSSTSSSTSSSSQPSPKRARTSNLLATIGTLQKSQLQIYQAIIDSERDLKRIRDEISTKKAELTTVESGLAMEISNLRQEIGN